MRLPYIGRHEDTLIICCCHTNDSLFGSENDDVLHRLTTKLGCKMHIVAKKNIAAHYNSLEIFQGHDYIQIYVAPYIDKILEEGKSDSRMIDPVHPSSIKELETSEAPTYPIEAKSTDTADGLPP
jgi:hypothetical protein